MARPLVDTPIARRTPADAEIDRLRDELRVALAGWRQAKRLFVDITNAYVNNRTPDYLAEIKAQGDARRVKAGADGAWYQQEVQTISLAILALDRVSTRDGDR